MNDFHVKHGNRATERGAGGATCPWPPKMFAFYVFDVTKIKDSDITDGSWVRAIVIALKMQGNSVSERWSPKRGTEAPRTGAYNIYDVIKGPKSIFCPGPHKTSRRPWQLTPISVNHPALPSPYLLWIFVSY